MPHNRSKTPQGWRNVEVGRLRTVFRTLADVSATKRGFALVPRRALAYSSGKIPPNSSPASFSVRVPQSGTNSDTCFS